MTQTPALDAAAVAGLDTQVQFVADPFVVSRSWAAHRPAESERQLAARRDALLADAALVIGTGGDLHTPDYGVSTRYLRALREAQQRGIPTVLVGQSWGVFDDTAEADALVAVASRCAMLSVREEASREYAVNKLGLADERIRLSSDPAFLLPAAPAEQTAAVLASCGVGPGDAYLCLAPSQGITRHSMLTDDQHLQALLNLVRHLAVECGVPVLLVPHCHDSRPHNDDRILVDRIAALAGHLGVRAVPGALSAPEYKAVLGGATLVVAERLHAAIGALSSGTPAVVVGHSHKFSGVLAHAYGPNVPADAFHLDIHALAEPGAWRPLASLPKEARLRRALTGRLPQMIAAARSDFTALRAALQR
ncbi:polysaccharide pyruvyl transferase family protein [Sphaerimonospora thailandensis]|uniref:polysaccharide pyruvyl transferase family protein n=1 Tax=Sphaerimonospora thailandensis TaxID=795644 RepID=UPI00194F95B7|nr:polysaccharide pyruvyl transferase family protein [Sphaerimonospora thailandensis]